MALIDMKIKDKYLYTTKDFANLQDYKLGDIVEAEIGVFMQVVDREDNKILTTRLAVIPEPSQYDDCRRWEIATDNMLLDLICDAKDEEEKSLFIHLMKHIKEKYTYEEFKKRLEAIR